MEGKQWEHELEQLPEKLLKKFPSLFIVCGSNQAKDVVKKMKARKSALDIKDERYVIAQNKVFRAVARRFEAELVDLAMFTLYSQEHFDYLLERINRFEEDVRIKIFSNALFYKEELDAGFDLTVQDYTRCPAGKATKLIFAEKIIIPAGYWAQLLPRSSTNLIGSIRSGVIDAEYTGPLTAVFTADEDLTLVPMQKIAQVVIQKCESAEIIALDEQEYLEKSEKCARGILGSGSTGTHRISMGSFFRKWQAQPRDDFEQKIYNRDAKNVLEVRFRASSPIVPLEVLEIASDDEN